MDTSMSDSQDHTTEKPRTLRSDRRVFIINLPFDEPWQSLRDWFKETINCEDAFVSLIKHPVNGNSTGAAHVEFRTVEDCEAAAARSTEEYKGRKIIINKDSDNMHLKVWCRKKNFSFRMDKQFKPIIESLDGHGSHGHHDAPPHHHVGGTANTGYIPREDRAQNRDRNESGKESNGRIQLEPIAVGYDPYGRPLINDVTDLLATSVFFSNFPFKVPEEDIEKLFSVCGLVSRIQLMYFWVGSKRNEFFREHDFY